MFHEVRRLATSCVTEKMGRLRDRFVDDRDSLAVGGESKMFPLTFRVGFLEMLAELGNVSRQSTIPALKRFDAEIDLKELTKDFFDAGVRKIDGQFLGELLDTV